MPKIPLCDRCLLCAHDYHLVCAIHPDGPESNEAVVFESLMTQGAVKRPAAGRPRLRPLRVVGDKGYSSSSIRRYLRRRGIRLTIPRKHNERRRGKFDKAIYRQRNRANAMFQSLKAVPPHCYSL